MSALIQHDPPTATATDAVHEWRHGPVVVSTDRARLDLDVVHGFLAGSYWAGGIPRATVERSVRHSLCFGAYLHGRQVGFARVISDRATYAYVADVFVLESARGQGIAKRLMECISGHPDLQGLRLWTLFTRDAHGLYRQFGFEAPRYPERLMERRRERAYAEAAGEVRS
jgi:GNAT superfamily N-acetyltransferase